MIRRLTVLGILLALPPCLLRAEPGKGGLELRPVEGGKVAPRGRPAQADVVRVFVHEGRPRQVHITADAIAVEYGQSGVVFDRADGRVRQHFTVADGWPEARPAVFGPPPARVPPIVGPGVVYEWRHNDDRSPSVAVEARFAGRTWRALQPVGFLVSGLRERAKGQDVRKVFGAWTPILKRLNEESYLEADREGGAARRYTTAGGLASNIVTHLAVADGALWAACADVYDADRKEWGLGGLCRYDKEADRWQKVEKIDGRPVRWVTLVQAVGDELWVGFREGSGVEGDSVVYGMGLYPGHYRPKTTAVVLARLKDGKWTSFTRPPLHGDTEPVRPPVEGRAASPTEVPRSLAVLGPQVILFSTTATARPSGNWDVPLAGAISLLDMKDGRWRVFRTRADLGAEELEGMTAAEGEVVVRSDRGAHRWDGTAARWRLLDPGSPLAHPGISAAAAVGDELWVGCMSEGFAEPAGKGIARYDERSGKWSFVSPEALGSSAPVRKIVPHQADVWVLFRSEERVGAPTAAAVRPFPETPVLFREGLALYSGGKWQFPAKLDGVPATYEVEHPTADGGTKKVPLPVTVQHLAAVGEKLYVGTEAGVYEGPGKWRRVLDGPVTDLAATADGKGLRAARFGKGVTPEGGRPYELGTFNPRSGKWDFRPAKAELPGREEREDFDPERYASEWVQLPTTGNRRWALGPLGAKAYRFVATPQAFWIVSEGRLIRVDREKLAALR